MFTGGCPFNQFGPCKQHECKFYVDYNNSSFDCAIIGTFLNSIAARTYSFIARNNIDILGFTSGQPLSPGLIDRLREEGTAFLLLLEEIKSDPDVPEAHKAQTLMAYEIAKRFLDAWGKDYLKKPEKSRKSVK